MFGVAPLPALARWMPLLCFLNRNPPCSWLSVMENLLTSYVVESIRVSEEALVAGKVPVTGIEYIHPGDVAGVCLLHLKAPATNNKIVARLSGITPFSVGPLQRFTRISDLQHQVERCTSRPETSQDVRHAPTYRSLRVLPSKSVLPPKSVPLWKSVQVETSRTETADSPVTTRTGSPSQELVADDLPAAPREEEQEGKLKKLSLSRQSALDAEQQLDRGKMRTNP
ncbi:hypothetical protein M409DRAFT_60287 [Zasmidium cellare ATCC 36951]|uniref:Uncharacterized protein n=1 Tax=Zasmidium cellare ATCC 36951 TaxID=1080233 RepID=A0A6A6BZ02_ZASCE|nr:uncharacterized protein M409DRAFT_60287 [Zasmidium cellare ATCC 36951]KAF2160024.1 hypothetical protein M409DRAFT_60287 [Zasmidium cellare ATCC 36951]